MKNTQNNIELIEARTLKNLEKPKCLNHNWQTLVGQNITKPTIYFLYFFLLSLSLSLPLSVSYTVALFTIIHGGTNIGHDAQIAKKRASHARIKIWIWLFGSKISWHSTMFGVVHGQSRPQGKPSEPLGLGNPPHRGNHSGKKKICLLAKGCGMTKPYLLFMQS
jgi:hypothetical protein